MSEFTTNFQIPLKNKTVPIDGFSFKVLVCLENEGINLVELQGLSSAPSFSILGKILWILVKYSSYTNEFRNITFDEFLDLLIPGELLVYFELITSIANKSFPEVKPTKNTVKKK